MTANDSHLPLLPSSKDNTIPAKEIPLPLRKNLRKDSTTYCWRSWKSLSNVQFSTCKCCQIHPITKPSHDTLLPPYKNPLRDETGDLFLGPRVLLHAHRRCQNSGQDLDFFSLPLVSSLFKDQIWSPTLLSTFKII